MEFIEIVLEKLGSIFAKYELHLIEQRSNYLKLQTNYLEVVVSHNEFENSNVLWLGSNNEQIDKVEIDNEALRLFFNSNLRLSQVSTETFINNLAIFFENEAQSILLGDANRLNQLEKFDLERSSNYTSELIQRQTLETASKAWEKNDYKEFIKSIDEIGVEKLPKSYQIKYKIAKQKE